MPPSSFQPEIEQSQAKLRRFRVALRGISNPEECQGEQRAVEDLAATLEELRGALLELQRHDDDLAASHDLPEADRARFFELLERGPTAYLIADTTGIILKANCAAEAFLNYPPGALAGRPLALLFREEQMGPLSEQMSLSGSERTNQTRHAWVRGRGRPDPVPVSVTVVPILRKRSFVVEGFRFIVRDLSEMIRRTGRIRELEDAIERRMDERAPRLIEELEHLRASLARYTERYGPLPPGDQSPFSEPKERAMDGAGADRPM